MDTDGDGLTDYEEVHGVDIPNIGVVVTDPTKVDTDGDGLSDYKEAKPTNPRFASNPTKVDTDGDGLSDYDEVMVMGTIPDKGDSDGDGIPDRYDILLPTINDWFIVLGAVGLIVLYQAKAYGMFRKWKKDVLAIGLSDSGGIPMFMLPEDFSTYDVNLISSGLLGIHALTNEISGRDMDTLVLSGDMPIFIRKGKHTIIFAFLRKQYPRLIKQLKILHMDLEEAYGDILESWQGLTEDIEDIRSWIMTRLGLPTKIKDVTEEFEETFKE